MVVRVIMDLFRHPYYRLNKRMLTCIGQWPNQSTHTKRSCYTVLIYAYASEMISRIRTICNHHDDANIVINAMLSVFLLILEVTFFVTSMVNSQKTLKLLNRICTDWQVWAREREVNIHHEYTELGKKLNIAFAVTVYSGGLLVGTEPAIEKIIDILMKNGTEPGKFILLIDYYYIDEQKYYFYVTVYFSIMCIVLTAPAVTQIIMLITYTQHGSGIFAALRYVKLIEAVYTWNFFISTAIGMLLINASGLQVLTQPNNLQVTMTCVALILVLGFIFLIECLASQILIDHSISIRVYIYNSQWYRLSPKAQKLLQYMTMRCNVPCRLTAGNMLIMSIRTVWLTTKTAVSYFTFVRSTQTL